ncbi:FRG domain-containing protein [Clostridium hydrogenum]|uniref:FRG domain-containing protein n=1 Tax=Clostridium hydrogenum TaxID=2855764 RepID=UPI001F28CBF4|nr:FRG domain-containing protein [Clostridium hydrogenum]
MTIKTIEDYIREVYSCMKKLKERFPHEELIFGYRGEAKDYEKTKMMPTLFRDNNAKDISSIENRVLESIIDNGISEQNNNLLDKTIDIQHYIAYSRLLDISFNSLVGLYFSVENENKEFDSYVYIIGIPKKYVFSPSSQYLKSNFEDILSGKGNIVEDNFKLILSSKKNERIIAQDGGFILFPGSRFHPIPNLYYEEITICKHRKKDIIKNLNVLFNINQSKIYPEKSYRKGKIDIDVNNRLLHTNYSIETEVDLFGYRLISELKCYKKCTKEDSGLKFERYKRVYRSEFKNILIKYIKDKDKKKYEEKLNQYLIQEKFI